MIPNITIFIPKPLKMSSKLWFTLMAQKLRSITKKTPLTVGVFQDHTVEEINGFIDSTGIDLVQLHGMCTKNIN